MSFSNLDYLYFHLPARFRVADSKNAELLKRFLEFFGITLDEWDEVYDTFFEKIDPDTAPEEFVEFFLWAFFGWSWFPHWFTLARKRRLYKFFARHLARRGTPLGIEEFLKEFSIYSRCYARPQYWGELVFGEDAWTITEPLGIAVQISHLADEVNPDIAGLGAGEFVWGEGYFAEAKATLTEREIEDLLRFGAPFAQVLMVEYQQRRNAGGIEAWESDQPILNENIIPDEVSGHI